MNSIELIDKLSKNSQLELDEWEMLISQNSDEAFDYAKNLAQKKSIENFGKKIFFRGIIEFTNICKNDCYYCGIRRSNDCVSRYRLDKQDILECCKEGYENGFRTFVLQGGEDSFFTDEVLCDIVLTIRKAYPDCAITLSVGERSRDSYQSLFDAGANRFLLRHETADKLHYDLLHPDYQLFENRIRCLNDLKEIGFQTGCGCMIGSPYQTARHLAKDMYFMCDFKPQMIGMGPFIPHKDTPFRGEKKGSTRLTLYLLSLSRIAMPKVLLPATTALGTVEKDGRAQGILHGANVIMPNLSPMNVRKKYMLYDNKIGTQNDTKDGLNATIKEIEKIGYTLDYSKGDYKND